MDYPRNQMFGTRARSDWRHPEVPVEVIVNGYRSRKTSWPTAIWEVSFDVPIERGSWVALHILPSHTNEIFNSWTANRSRLETVRNGV
jgi:hypothetical protein